MATFLDVYHPVRQFYEANIRDRDQPKASGLLLQWDPGDPLADVALATFGAYPAKGDIGIDYAGFFDQYLAAESVNLDQTGAFPPEAYSGLTPNVLTGVDLKTDHSSWGRDDPGFYYGDCRDFADLVSFWNIRASGTGVLFYDPTHRTRIQGMTDHYLAALRSRPKIRVVGRLGHNLD